MPVVLGVSVGREEVRVVRATTTDAKTRVPDLVLERGSLSVADVLRVVALLTRSDPDPFGR